MDEQNLLKLSLIVSFIGILLLTIISENIEIKEYKIKELNKKHLEKTVKIKGTITRITETPGLFIFNINDGTGEITAILFKEDPINLTINQNIMLQGKIKEYKNKIEIQTDQINKVNN